MNFANAIPNQEPFRNVPIGFCQRIVGNGLVIVRSGLRHVAINVIGNGAKFIYGDDTLKPNAGVLEIVASDVSFEPADDAFGTEFQRHLRIRKNSWVYAPRFVLKGVPVQCPVSNAFVDKTREVKAGSLKNAPVNYFGGRYAESLKLLYSRVKFPHRGNYNEIEIVSRL